MDEYYQQFLSSVAGANNQTMLGSEGTSHSPTSPTAMSASYHNFSYFPGFSEMAISGNVSKAPKGRRKSSSSLAGADAVKHRRTRSGCFTCRSRRVKCDENRPICERCRKGSRDCVYPDLPTTSTKSGQNSKPRDQTTPTSSNDDEIDEDRDEEGDTKLATIVDENEKEDNAGNITTPSTSSGARNASSSRTRATSDGFSAEDRVSPANSTITTSSMNTLGMHASEMLSPLRDDVAAILNSSHLPWELQYYLSYFSTHITYYHYGLTSDSDEFFTNTLLSLSFRNEALLNAVAAFAAYHSTVQNVDGQLSTFLKFYNRSVKLLLSSLKRRDSYNVSTLLTILQLATIEEYLGDWVNLMGHQKAAFEILMKIFEPSSIMQNPIGRICLSWYTRYDNTVALMGALPTTIPREWLVAMVSFYEDLIRVDPLEIKWKIDDRWARLRLISYDMSHLCAKTTRGQLAPAEYTQEHASLTKRLIQWRETWDPSLTDPGLAISEFPWRQTRTDFDIVNPCSPGVLYDMPIFSSTLLAAQWHAVIMMHKSQAIDATSTDLAKMLVNDAYAICQYFEAVELWPDAPAGALFPLQSCLAMAALFLPQDERHHSWLRHKFALLESNGYIYPVTRRARMAELIGDPTCLRWWLPNDEGFSPILKIIRTFTEERNAAVVSPEQESVRETRHLFTKLEVTRQ